MRRKYWIGTTLSAVCLVAAVYFVSPYFAFRGLQAALKTGDRDRLEAEVDFPALRANLKSEFNAMMMAKYQNDPALRNNPFAGLGMLLVPAMIDKMIDGIITSEVLSVMIANAQVPKDDPTNGDAQVAKDESAVEVDSTSRTRIDPNVTTSYSYVSIDRFRVTLTNVTARNISLSFIFDRSGFIAWKLVRIDLPANAFQ